MGGRGKAIVAALAILVLAAGFLLASGRRDLPFTTRQQVFSLGLYAGSEMADLSAASSNPVITRSDIGDPDVIGVADPWLIVAEDLWYLFFESIERRPGAPNDQHGVIGLAVSQDHGESWVYQGVVLEESWHLSYPHVFAVDGAFYMVPESMNAGSVMLYRASSFPDSWESTTVLLEGEYTDPTIFEHDGSWWLFVTESVDEADDTMRLFHAEHLEGPYVEHPDSPVVAGDVSMARSAGPVTPTDAGLVRFAMDNTDGYGRAVRGFVITTLDITQYEEEEVSVSPILTGSGEGWNADGMHHFAPTQLPDGSWVSAVDGFYYERLFGFEY